jgi:hypothetical protein
MKLVRLIKMCLHETYSKVSIGKYLSGTFAIPNGLKQSGALISRCLYKLQLQKPEVLGTWAPCLFSCTVDTITHSWADSLIDTQI